MRYYNIKTTNTNDYIVRADFKSQELKTLAGNLELTLFAFRGGGYVFESKGENPLWMRVYPNNKLRIIRPQNTEFFSEEISERDIKY